MSIFAEEQTPTNTPRQFEKDVSEIASYTAHSIAIAAAA
jgi:hypothetical protein